MTRQLDHYRTLGVTPSASEDEIRRAYRTLAKRHHPDRVPAERRSAARIEMARINAAHDVLSDPERRAQYDSQQGYSTPVGSPSVPEQEEADRHRQTVRRAVDTSWRPQGRHEHLRRRSFERGRVLTLTSGVLLGIVLLAALVSHQLLGLDTTSARCGWALVLVFGALFVLAGLQLTEL